MLSVKDKFDFKDSFLVAFISFLSLYEIKKSFHKWFLNVIQIEKTILNERLGNPASRGDSFTQKCLNSADRNKTALVRYSDLFRVAKYLSGKKDKIFVKESWKAIKDAVGIVRFPDTPDEEASKSENFDEDSKN